jgi:hypothetical protein
MTYQYKGVGLASFTLVRFRIVLAAFKMSKEIKNAPASNRLSVMIILIKRTGL